MSQLRAYRYRVYPTSSQHEKLEAWLAFNCWLYNCAREERESVGQRIRQHTPPGPYAGAARRRPFMKPIATKASQGREFTQWRQWAVQQPPSLGADGKLHYLLPPGMPSQVQRDALHRVDLAFAAWFKGLRGESSHRRGFPKPRRREQYRSLTFTVTHDNTAGCARIHGQHVELTGLGPLRIRWHRPLPEDAVPKTVTLSRDAGRWYASIAIEIPDPAPLKTEPTVAGLHLGVWEWVTLWLESETIATAIVADLNRILAPASPRQGWEARQGARQRRLAVSPLPAPSPAPSALSVSERPWAVLIHDQQGGGWAVSIRNRFPGTPGNPEFERAHQRVLRWQRKLSRCRRGSERRRKVKEQLSRAWEEERQQRKDHRDKVAYILARHLGTVYFPELDSSELAQHEKDLPGWQARRQSDLTRRLLDQGWYAFRLALERELSERGGTLIVTTAKGIARHCAQCGADVPKEPLDRLHACLECGYRVNRTVNSARNVLLFGRNPKLVQSGP